MDAEILNVFVFVTIYDFQLLKQIYWKICDKKEERPVRYIHQSNVNIVGIQLKDSYVTYRTHNYLHW